MLLTTWPRRAGYIPATIATALASTAALAEGAPALPSAAPPTLVVPGGPAPQTPNPVSPIPGIVPQQQPRILPPAILPAAPAETVAGAAIQVKVTAVTFEGATAYSPEDLRAMFAPLQQGIATRAQITDAVRQLQLKYRADGYFLTKVTGTTEPVGDGVALKVRVIEGYISSVKLAGDVGPVGTLIYGYLRNLEDIRPVRIADLERYVLLAQNLPGIRLRTLLRPARDEPGAVELVASVERKPFEGFLTDDDRGPRTAGPNELLAGIQANSFTGLGERTQVFIFNTPFDDEEVFGQASFDSYVGTEGLKLSTYLGYGLLKPGDTLRPAGYRSRLLLGGVGAEYPVIRSRQLSLFLDGNFDISNTIIDLNEQTRDADHRASKDDLRIFRVGTRVEVQDTILGAEFAAADKFEIKIHQGFPGLIDGTKDTGTAASRAARPSRPDEKNDFTKITAEISRTQALYTWTTTNLDLYVASAGQWTGDVLPPTEKFFLGGVQFGRGFYYGEVTGDRAVAGTVELQLNDPVDLNLFGYGVRLDPLQYYGFYDVGQTWNVPVTDLRQRVESAGAGVRMNITQYLSVQVEGVERFTRRPSGSNVSLEREHAGFFKVSLQF